MIKRITQVLSSLLMLVCISAHAETIAVGQKIAPLQLNDQHDQVISIKPQTQYLLFSRDMKGGEVIQDVLATYPDNAAAKLVYLADISGMPSLIARFVAIPKMKDFTFAVGLDHEGNVTADLPSQEESATVVTLNNNLVTAIDFIGSSDALTALLAK
ncbi:hypothetical protein ACFOD0_04480 [Shewanella intestini]|uniref:FAD/FMN-containing dehydrogenase n=1 Tax=Shewanella intestini TaxID=2017544 RepID=A0ABS5I0L3_9GAMM|nr:MULTISPECIES: hypothetical protein [Shewanella]MBR9727560.1 hypothetical protein [Shewanella intestini]MRG35290.1 hypothetical protein [Shewanella sp. XMDDZSB0408]